MASLKLNPPLPSSLLHFCEVLCSSSDFRLLFSGLYSSEGLCPFSDARLFFAGLSELSGCGFRFNKSPFRFLMFLKEIYKKNKNRNVWELYIALQMATNISETLVLYITHNFTVEIKAAGPSKSSLVTTHDITMSYSKKTNFHQYENMKSHISSSDSDLG